MNTAQKVIKYVAIGFAAALIVAIFSGIFFGGYGIFRATNLIKENNVELVCETEPCLKIALGRSNLEVKKGTELSVESDYDGIEIKQDGNKILIKENDTDWFGKDRKITIVVPETMEFEEVNIAGGVGKIDVEFLKAKNLKLALGVGETRIEKLDAKNAEINTGIGELRLGLIGVEQDYEIEAKRGIGEIRVADRELGRNEIVGSGERKVKINGGIGEIRINFVQ